jgi:hypothetical protein
VQWLRIDRWLDFLSGPQVIWGLLWLGLVLVTLALMALMVTRWGQSRPLGKCVALSLLTHALLATYAMTVEIVAAAPREILVRANISDDLPSEIEAPAAQTGKSKGQAPDKPWERLARPAPATPHDAALERPETDDMPASERMPAELSPVLPDDATPEKLTESEPRAPEPDAIRPPPSRSQPLEAAAAEPIEAPAAMRREAADPVAEAETGPELAKDVRAAPQKPAASALPGLPDALLSEAATLPRMTDLPAGPAKGDSAPRLAASPARNASPLAPEMEADAATGEERPARPNGAPNLNSIVGRGMPSSAEARLAESLAKTNGATAPQLSPRRDEEGERALPSLYQLRRAPQRAEITERQGGSAATEAAVKAALKWLAANQHVDGRWDASLHGAGRELKVAGQDRNGAGAESDTGVTGLALLAFFGAGNTHLEGDYRENVARGIAYLLDVQGDDGNLGGSADRFAFMYCHGMATLALSEVYAMSGDQRLLEPVRRAIGYTLGAQSRASGGWRYGVGDKVGDTSQLGWQLMALKSAELAGLEIPAHTRAGMIKFLKSVASGPHSGLASYRAGERATVSMTAEALVCRQFLGLGRSNPASDEAGNFILTQLPGQGQPNLYYWYYATLGMFQLQGERWRRWNNALTATLVARQRNEDELAGSWDPDDVWGGHGGRVYTTAMGALCLEVYYRFLPLYVKASGLEDGGK